MKQKALENNFQISLLSAVYFCRYLENSWLDDKNNARHYLIKAVEDSPTILGNFENFLFQWIYQKKEEKKINLAIKALSNFPEKIFLHKISKRHILGRMYINQAFSDHKTKKRFSCIKNVIMGLFLCPSNAKNYGVWAIFGKSLLGIKDQTIEHTFITNILNVENAPPSLIQKIEIQIEGKINQVELISNDLTDEICYKVLTDQKEYILRTFQKNNDLLKTRLELIKSLEVHQIPMPSIIIYEQANKKNGIEFEWLLEKKIQGERFFPVYFDRNENQEIMKNIALFFKRIHNIKKERFGYINQKNDQIKMETFVSWLSREREIILAGFITGAISESFASIIENAFRFLKENYFGPPVLCHGDLQPENILVKDNKIQGIIDWEAANGNDPAYDIAVFFTAFHKWFPSYEDEFIINFLKTYNVQKDQTFLFRIKAHQIIISANLRCWLSNITINDHNRFYCQVIRNQIDQILSQPDIF